MSDQEVTGCVVCYGGDVRLYEGDTKDLEDVDRRKICEYVEEKVKWLDAKIVKVVHKEDRIEFYVDGCSMEILQHCVNQEFGKYGLPFESWFEDEGNEAPLLVAFTVYER